MSERKTVPVTTRAIVQRVNRKLTADHEHLRTTRGERWRDDFGAYFIVDDLHGEIVQTHVDVEALAREIGVLRAWESKAD